jgi:hypothetical protein
MTPKNHVRAVRYRQLALAEPDKAEWVVEGLQGLPLEVEISEIVVREADEPNAVIDLFPATRAF